MQLNTWYHSTPFYLCRNHGYARILFVHLCHHGPFADICLARDTASVVKIVPRGASLWCVRCSSSSRLRHVPATEFSQKRRHFWRRSPNEPKQRAPRTWNRPQSSPKTTKKQIRLIAESLQANYAVAFVCHSARAWFCSLVGWFVCFVCRFFVGLGPRSFQRCTWSYWCLEGVVCHGRFQIFGLCYEPILLVLCALAIEGTFRPSFISSMDWGLACWHLTWPVHDTGAQTFYLLKRQGFTMGCLTLGWRLHAGPMKRSPPVLLDRKGTAFCRVHICSGWISAGPANMFPRCFSRRGGTFHWQACGASIANGSPHWPAADGRMPLLTTDCRGQPCLQWKTSLVGMPISRPFRSQSHSSWHLQAIRAWRYRATFLFSFYACTALWFLSREQRFELYPPGRSAALPNFPQTQFAVAHCHWQQLLWLRSPTLGCAHGIQGNVLRGVNHICCRLQSFSVPTKRAVNVMVAAPLSVKMQHGCGIQWLIPTQGGHLGRNPAQQLFGQSFHSTPGFSLASATGPRLPDILKRCEKVLLACLHACSLARSLACLLACFFVALFLCFFVCLFCLLVVCWLCVCVFCLVWFDLVWFGLVCLFVCACVCVFVWSYIYIWQSCMHLTVLMVRVWLVHWFAFFTLISQTAICSSDPESLPQKSDSSRFRVLGFASRNQI